MFCFGDILEVIFGTPKTADEFELCQQDKFNRYIWDFFKIAFDDIKQFLFYDVGRLNSETSSFGDAFERWSAMPGVRAIITTRLRMRGLRTGVDGVLHTEGLQCMSCSDDILNLIVQGSWHTLAASAAMLWLRQSRAV